ncbi:MAG: ferritin [Armatimonadetes bacterium]|nr:ferritin [Armatimonadota bacterium]
MGTKGRAVVEVDLNELIGALRRAYLDELLASHSYWITALVAEGWAGEELSEHFKEEAAEELKHAQRLATRIIELGGNPVVHPKDWEAGATAPWVAPRAKWADANGMVADQIKAEAGAIDAYNALAKMTFGKDPVTHALVTELLADEVRHEEFLENLSAGSAKP